MTESARFFLKSLKLDGVQHLYIPRPATAQPAKPVPSAASDLPAPAAGIKAELMQVREKALACVRCSELAATRKSVVFGSGNIKANLMFVGEAPGREEDEQGLPFVGQAGQLLTKIIESIGLNRNQVFIANVLKCRPPQNRPPAPEEISNCEPFLMQQIDLIKPRILCALGTFAAQTLLKTGQSISSLRSQFRDYRGIKLLCTFHPAYLLRNPGEKRKVWEDMKMIKRELETSEP